MQEETTLTGQKTLLQTYEVHVLFIYLFGVDSSTTKRFHYIWEM